MAVAGCVAAAMCLPACGLGAGERTAEVTLTVSKEFGSIPLGSTTTSTPPASETAMRQLQRAYDVKTSYAGRFVSAIRGVKGGTDNGRPVDWFYFVNGIEAPVGAADTLLHGGDSIWWDFRDWGAATHVPAVVGSWPHPFTGGLDGKRPAVRILCAPHAEAACAVVERQLAKEGVAAARGLAGTAGKGAGLRVLVGEWKEIRPDPAAQLVEEGPSSSGVYLLPRVAWNGTSVAMLNPRGIMAKLLTGSVSIVAATSVGDGLPTWMVSGTDAASVVVAANHLTAKDLRLHYAVAWSGGAATSAPLVGEK